MGWVDARTSLGLCRGLASCSRLFLAQLMHAAENAFFCHWAATLKLFSLFLLKLHLQLSVSMVFAKGVLVVDPTSPNVLAPHPSPILSVRQVYPNIFLCCFVLVVSRRHHPIPTYSLGAERRLVGQTETSALGILSSG